MGFLHRKICKRLLVYLVMTYMAVLAEEVELNPKISSEQNEISEPNISVEEKYNIDTHSNPSESTSPESSTLLQTPEGNKDSNTEKGTLKTEDEDALEQVYKECKENLSCAERRMVALVDRLDSKKSIALFDDYITLEKTSEAADVVPENDVVAEPSEALLSRVDSYLRSHSIRIHIPKIKSDIPDQLGRLLEGRSLDIGLGTLTIGDASEGRGRLKKLILPLILGFKLKLAILLPIFIGTIALISFKGLWAGLAAMLVSGALGLKTLLSNNDGSNSPSTRFTVGVVKPHIVPEIYHSDYLSGWSRTVPLPADHPYRTEHYRPEHPYRGYYPPSWDRPVAAAAAK